MRGLAFHPFLGATPPAQGGMSNTGCRVVLVSLYGPLPDSHLFAVLFGSTVDIISVSLHWLLLETETDTHSAYCACFGRLHSCSSWTRCDVAPSFCTGTDQLDLPVVADQFPMVQIFLHKVPFLVTVMPVVGAWTPQFRTCTVFTVVDTPSLRQTV